MIGSIVFATEQGLGYLAKDFHDHGLLDKVLIYPHSSRKSHTEWFPNSRLYSKEEISWLLEGLDTLLLFETAFDWSIIPEAQKRGITVVLMPMHECTPYPLPYQPDVILAPSLLEEECYPGSRGVVVPTEQTWKLRERAKVFVHNGGNLGIGGRNGTKEVLKAMEYVKSPIQLIVRTQCGDFTSKDPRITIEKSVPRETLYSVGDVFLFPEKFNGLSLPIQEAFASGMAIMCGARKPMTSWLPNEIMIPVSSYVKDGIARMIDVAVFDPKDIAWAIDKWYNQDISMFSVAGKKWAEQYTWDNLRNNFSLLCEK